MTTEDDFHRALDANPDDHHTRLVFADWLQDHDDPRAAGYRAMGTLGHRPYYGKNSRTWLWYRASPSHRAGGAYLPDQWVEATVGMRHDISRNSTRRHAEDAAALAFSTLSPERQQEIINPQPPPEQLTRRRLARRRYGKM